MTSRQLLYRVLYRIGFAPWDGHPLAKSLQTLIEGDSHTPALKPGTALDVGCGTGDNSIYLAKHGWQVTGVDFVETALEKARAKAAAENVDIRFERADVTRLGEHGIGSGFELIVDNGCLHGMNDDDRRAYAREVTAAAAPGARLLLVEFLRGTIFGVPGINPDEVEALFATGWKLLSSGPETAEARKGQQPAWFYVFERVS